MILKENLLMLELRPLTEVTLFPETQHPHLIKNA